MNDAKRDLPLQRDLHPWSPGLRRIAMVLALALAVILAGWLAPSRQTPPLLILGGPKHEGDYARVAEQLIAGAHQRLWMAMYVIHPGDPVVDGLLAALAAASARGVDVRVCLDLGAPRDGVVDDKHVAAEAWLRAHNVHVVLDEANKTTHAKLLVADSRTVLAGSHNWTRSALSINREASWLVEDPAAAAEAEAWLAAVPGW